MKLTEITHEEPRTVDGSGRQSMGAYIVRGVRISYQPAEFCNGFDHGHQRRASEMAVDLATLTDRDFKRLQAVSDGLSIADTIHGFRSRNETIIEGIDAAESLLFGAQSA